jgi:tetratricopeptide (TPR) repeat protein
LALPLFKIALGANPTIDHFWISYIDPLIKKPIRNSEVYAHLGQKGRLVGDNIDILEAQLKQMTRPTMPMSTEKKKSLTLKEKRRKISESKKLKKQARGKSANDVSPSQSQLSNLLERYQSGRLVESERLAMSMTKQFPKHQFGWKVLGAVLLQIGRISEALDANQKLVSLSPQDAVAYYNLGTTLQKLGRLDEAEASLRQAIVLKADFPEAHYNLGMSLQEMGRLEEAEVSYRQTIVFKPDYVEAHNNLGAALKELGRLEEADGSLRQAIVFKPDYAEAYNNLGDTLQELGKFEEAEASLRQAIALKADFPEAQNNLGRALQGLGRLEESEASFRKAIVLKPAFAGAMLNLSTVLNYMNNLDESVLLLKNLLEIEADELGLRAAVSLAIHRFLEGDTVGSKELLLKCQKIQEKTSLIFKNGRIYQKFLLEILSWHENKSPVCIKDIPNKKLYVIGESHSLTSHGLRIQSFGSDVLCQSFLIEGCKQSDLGSNIKNQFKNKLRGIFCTLPESSEILLAVGEIDCRLDSGIIKHRNKYPEKNMVKLIKTTVENYINYIFELNSEKRHGIIIQGVPCPNIDTKDIAAEKVQELIDVIREFNVVLKNKSNEVGFGFLDVHKLTDNGNGFSNSIWHLDSNHLSPGGMQEAWREHATH